MADGAVVIKIDGDDSGLQRELKKTTASIQQATGKLAAAYRKTGMNQSDAMTRAWAEVKDAYSKGTTIMIDGIETVITKQEKLASKTRALADSGYGTLANSADAAARSIIEDLDSVEKKTVSLSAGLKKVGSVVKTAVKGLSIVGTAVGAALSAAGLASVKYIASIEQLEASFATMTGSAEKAASIIDRLRKLGAETPFETTDLAEVTQLLMQYGMDADVAIDRMTMLGDISQGSADKMSRIATAYGQMTSAGKVQLEDVKQMIEAGFNPLLEISERTGESMGSLYDRISKGTLAVDEITQAMRSATSEGGKFYKSMERQSETINGLFSTIKDEAQDLGGMIFEPLAESLRSAILPGTRDFIGELKEGFASGGIDGMVDALTARTPRLIQAGVQGATKMFSAIGKQLPSLMKSLFSTIPSLLAGAVDIAPQITDALFAVLSNGVELLIGQLPQLIPSLARGIKDLFVSAAVGITDVVGGITAGAAKALKDLGLISLTTDEAFDRILADYDRDHVEKLKAMIELEPDVTVGEADFELNSLYETIEKTLTDGLADTPEIITELEGKVTDYYNTQIEKINAWRENALANLDNTLPQAEYDAAVKDINDKADQMVLGLQNASNATITFIDENAGKATTSVQNNLTALETIYNTAVGYRDQIAAMTGEARSAMDQQRNLVAAGQVKDEGTQINAIMYTAQEYANAVERAEEIKQQAIDKAVADNAAGILEDYAAEEERILAEYEASLAEAALRYEANMAEVWSGITEAASPEIAKKMKKAQDLEQMRTQLSGIMGLIVDAFSNPDVISGEIPMQEYVEGALAGMNFSDVDYAALAETLGIDEIDPAKIQEILVQKITDAAKLEQSGSGSVFGNLIGDLDYQLREEIAAIYGSVDADTTQFEAMLQAGIEEGAYKALETVDLSTAEGKLQLILGQFGDASYATVGTTVTAGVANAMSDTSAVEAASTAVGDASVSDIDRTSEATTAGKNTGQGYINGLRSTMSGAIAAAKAIARETLRALNKELEVESPSRKAMRSGVFVGEGFRIGMESSLKDAVRTAENIAGSLNLAPKLTAPDLSNAFTSAAQGWADVESTRPIYMLLRGKVVGEALAADNARAANNYNRSIALGVGKG